MVYLQPDVRSNNWNLWNINSAQNKQQSQNDSPVKTLNIGSRDARLQELKDKLLAGCLRTYAYPLIIRNGLPDIMLSYIGFTRSTYPAGFLSPAFWDVLESLSGDSRPLNRAELRNKIDALSWLESNILKTSLDALQGTGEINASLQAADCLRVYHYPLVTRSKLPAALEYYTAPHTIGFSKAFQAIVKSLSGESNPLNGMELLNSINLLSWLESDILKMLLNDMQNDVKKIS